MRLPPGIRRKPAEAGLISLVNIVFLLLVFFMIMGRLAPPEALAVDPPAAVHAVAADPVNILVLVDAEGRIAVDSERVDADALPGMLSKYISAYPAERRSADVVVKADGNIRFDQLEPVLEMIRVAGVAQLSLATDSSR